MSGSVTDSSANEATSKLSPKNPACECRPLVIVEGFLGRAGSAIWGNFEHHLKRGSCEGCTRRIIFTSVGPVSSLHDRACELYYSLVGGRVDYGEEHSNAHDHGRYGRIIPEGLYPEWSVANALHFLGHSIGGSTIIKLQHLIRTGHFGHHAHPGMVLSVNSISSPYRGTQIVFTLGERTDAAPAVRPLSLGSMLAKGVHIVSYLSPFLPRVLDLHIDSRLLSLYDITPLELLKQLWKSDWAESRDATPYDVTFEAADEREANGEGEIYPGTWYRSWCAYTTQKTDPSNSNNNTHAPSMSLSVTQLALAPLYVMARAIGSFDFSTLQPPPSFLQPRRISTTCDPERAATTEYETLPEEYYANDGVVPLFSQWHPFACA
ncbi:alpha beta-hydrolase domain-containing protein [Moniliophthora roreri MCA 2997]|uniref:Alpha beta-hydrolase domain-containing protein n=1 Tax=Moniliophthora roreri (strain MCA 2997) TaxID=1381753 RepID=V2XZX2_MONRO|nr:alpha beta-hydrolase domain-containing protein [Moniliophthora roreri MCA 2997]